MKKVILAVLAVVLIVASCSKEKKLNKRLDGEWNVTKFGGQVPPTGYSISVKFDKDKKGKGTYTFTNTDPSGTNTETGSYVLEKDEMIIMTETGATTSDTSYIVEYSKSVLKISDTKVAADSTTIEFEKK